MRPRPRFAAAGQMIENLEARVLFANVLVDATQTVRSVGSTMVGSNLAWWQAEMDTSRMGQMIRDARLGLLRMPGGSSSNTNLHFNAPAPWGGYKTAQIMAKVVESAGADGMISVNYGTGSPQEAAAYLAYYNASVGGTTVIGLGEQWDDTNRVWVWKDWKTAGYWASLRAAAPLAVDDGLNQLRAGHPAPWHFTYWEIGNENFATWEKNEHTYGGTATASSQPVAGSGAVQAFDENTATKWVGTFSGSAWLQYQFFNNQPLVVRQYRITSSADIATNPNRSPKNWTLQASNDSSTWVTLDTRTNQSDITNSHQKVYTIANTTAYRYYRLNISAIRGTETQVELGELQLVYDVTTYVNFAKTFSDLAHQIDPTTRVGLVSTLAMQWNLPNQTWTSDMLAACAQVGLVPGFLSDHVYVGGQTDQNLLLHTVNDPTFSDGFAPQNWAGRTQAYRTLINTWMGASAPNVKIMLTEFNSDLSTKQVTNLVSGLWIADAMAGAMQTEYASSLQWDLTNGYGAKTDNPALYGWRTGSDDGLISTGTAAPPTSGPYIPYPAYFGASLAGMLVHTGQSVVRVTSDDANLSAYAVTQANGDVYLLVINKSATTNLTGNFSLTGFYTTGQATILRYGKAEDTAQSLTTDGAAAFTTFTQNLGVANSTFSYLFPSYSMTLLELPKAPAGPGSAAMMVNTGAVQRSMVTSLTVTFDVAVNLASDAMALLNRRTGAVFAPAIANPLGDGRNWVLTFSGAGIVAGSLPDGAYRLSVKASSVHDAYGQALFGGDRAFKFNRLFGDMNGHSKVNGTDLMAFRSALNQPGNYLWYLDYDGTSGIDQNDYLQFRKRMNAGLL